MGRKKQQPEAPVKPQFGVGLIPDRAGMVVFVANGRIVAEMTWLEALNVGATMTFLAVSAAKLADVPEDVFDRVSEQAMKGARLAGAQALDMMLEGPDGED